MIAGVEQAPPDVPTRLGELPGKEGEREQSLTIGVLAKGDPEDPAELSGVPSSILAALRGLRCTAIPITVSPVGAVSWLSWRAGALPLARPDDLFRRRHRRGRLWATGRHSRPVHLAIRYTVRRQLAAADRLDALIQLEGELTAPPRVPMVTFHDSTLAQAVRSYDWPHLHGLTRRELARNLAWQRAAYESAIACCAATHWVADSLEVDYGISREKIHVLGRGANHRMSSPPDRDWSTPRFLFVGMDWRRKNGQGVLDAFARVRREFPAATLDVVGDHPSIEAAGVTAHGRLSPRDPAARSALRARYQQATAFVLPSFHEPLGLSHIEAATAGVASIGTTDGGAATFIADTGRCVDPLDADALVEAMLEFGDGEFARRMGERACERAKLFTWELVAERLLRALALPGVDVSGLAPYL